MVIKNQAAKGYQFGTFKGVFTPSLLTILGVIMYLRYGWVLGNVGLPQTLLIVTMATVITFITTLSISEFATNMRMGVGGAYYIISRSLGVEAGAAIGVPLFFAKALGISFYIAGFAESVVGLYPSLSFEFVGIATLLVLTIVSFFSADMALKLQFIILAFIVASLVSFFTGSNPSVGIADATTIPAMIPKQSFWLVFAVFFPAVTGIEAGLSMSGDLKNPEKALPLGTLAAVGVSYVIYMAIPVFLSYLKISDAELLTNSLIMRDVGRWGNLIICGIWAASISSALGALLGAPRTLQALAADGIVFRGMGKGSGKDNNPRVAILISFVIAFGGLFLGGLNAIATILSMFFLISYGLLNLAAGMEGLIANPSWRPKFKVSWIWPMFGALCCFLCMLMINAGATIVSLAIIFIIYYIMQRRKLSAYWGDTKYGILMLCVRILLYKLIEKTPHAKTWRPNILVLSGSPTARWHLIEIADAISHGKGFLTVAAILAKDSATDERTENMEKTISAYLRERSVPALVKVITAENVIYGARELINTYGFGPLEPNTILLGETRDAEKVPGYASMLKHIFQNRKNLIIVRESQTKIVNRTTARIDLWWSHLGNNSGLMLALAYLIKTSPEWAGAILTIKSIVKTPEEQDQQLSYFREFIEKENMDAQVEIYVLNSRKPFTIISEKSKSTDLVFFGMKPFATDGEDDHYEDYYQELIQNTSELSTAVFVLAAEEIDFDGIFKLRQIE